VRHSHLCRKTPQKQLLLLVLLLLLLLLLRGLFLVVVRGVVIDSSKNTDAITKPRGNISSSWQTRRG
jgi:hypothetical protein